MFGKKYRLPIPAILMTLWCLFEISLGLPAFLKYGAGQMVCGTILVSSVKILRLKHPTL